MELSKGRARSEVKLKADPLGNDLVVYLFNQGAHIGAVAMGEYDPVHGSASVSLITRLGHKEDVIAQRAAYRISKSMRKTVCVVAGIHLDEASSAEIKLLVRNTSRVVEAFIEAAITG
jgi:gallate decarboxylase subunit D